MPSSARRAAGANLPQVRDHNTALVLDLVRRGGAISRVELAAQSGLTAQAITKIVQRLQADGLVTDAGRTGSTGGKPRTLLRLDPTARYAVGVHLDRDDTTVVLTDLTAQKVTRHHLPHGMTGDPAGTLDRVADAVRAVVTGIADTSRLVGVGIACPGPLDHTTGVLHRVTGLPQWNGYRLGAEAADRLGVPVIVDKDTNAAALGQTLSVPDGPNDFAYLYHGRGLGAGLVLGGRVYRGRRTNAGEFGHQVLDLNGPPCRCGNRGCLEALSRAALDTGDPAHAAHLVGIAAANLIHLLDIDHIVAGGPVVLTDPEQYLSQVATTINALLPEPDWQRISVTLAADPTDAIATGAAALALAPLFDTATTDTGADRAA
ncbi:ROK family transcriptional regulator [Actinoplanes sichuanensis]|uniref:ROK family protein n=1 Tax=Actinoplanes sichuanensis TaxID=512349 RepID=A0ABW4A2B5_9ACTN|nr:ROK family transcriptional regulator [Actinoplanes sichuanensis]BEL12872.1 ROK family transcriptional regulator [Actinoplanes sichuanensis]